MIPKFKYEQQQEPNKQFPGERQSFFNASRRESDASQTAHRLAFPLKKEVKARAEKKRESKSNLMLPDLTASKWGGSSGAQKKDGKHNEAEMMLKRFGRLNLDFSTKYEDHAVLVKAFLHANDESDENSSVSESVQEVSRRRPLVPKFIPPVVIDNSSSRVRIIVRTYLRELYKQTIERTMEPPKQQKSIPKRHPLSGNPYKVHLPAIAFQQKGGYKIRPDTRLKYVESALTTFEGYFAKSSSTLYSNRIESTRENRKRK